MYDAGESEAAQIADTLHEGLVSFLAPLLRSLDARIDRRLVRTFVGAVEAIVCFRNRPHGLLLSELGAYLLDPAHGPAGTKRLSNLLRCAKWSSRLIEQFLWQQATSHLEDLETNGEAALLLWDESVIEKPESIADPDLGSVRSSKAHRLTRIKQGFYQRVSLKFLQSPDSSVHRRSHGIGRHKIYGRAGPACSGQWRRAGPCKTLRGTPNP